jgi:transcriptional regulator with GAF, ATPase, and Fis domain
VFAALLVGFVLFSFHPNSLLLSPLFVDDNAVKGVLRAYAAIAGTFTPEHEALLRALAGLVGLAYQRVLTHTEVLDQLEDARAVAESRESVAEAAQQSTALVLAARAVGRARSMEELVVAASSAVSGLGNAESGRLLCVPEEVPSRSDCCVSRCVRIARPVEWVLGGSDEQPVLDSSVDVGLGQTAHDVLCVPVMTLSGSTCGVLRLVNSRSADRRFDTETVERIVSFAELLAPQLDLWQQSTLRERETERQAREWEAVADRVSHAERTARETAQGVAGE